MYSFSAVWQNFFYLCYFILFFITHPHTHISRRLFFSVASRLSVQEKLHTAVLESRASRHHGGQFRAPLKHFEHGSTIWYRGVSGGPSIGPYYIQRRKFFCSVLWPYTWIDFVERKTSARELKKYSKPASRTFSFLYVFIHSKKFRIKNDSLKLTIDILVNRHLP